ncbi:hypothetical protein L345_13495, partial [Ophiophagus hannah]
MRSIRKRWTICTINKGDCKNRGAPGGATQRVNAKRLLSHVFDKREEKEEEEESRDAPPQPVKRW